MNAQGPHTRTAEDQIVDWRRRLLCRAGFPPPVAGALARDGRYDLHALIELTERGCPPALRTGYLQTRTTLSKSV